MSNYEMFLVADNIITIVFFGICLIIGMPLVAELISLSKKIKRSSK